jgi:ATP-dependent helicase/nuclease subunit A
MSSAPTQTNSLTPTQRRVVAARGNVLVMAGAGTGKTKTLIERCLDCLECDGAAMDKMLIVTFTEAAAAEMRERLRRAIEAKAQTEAVDHQLSTINNPWAEHLARFDLAHIGTLHSFCLKLVREHFYELHLDPRVVMLDEGEARQLANETLDEQFTDHYKGGNEFALAVQDLIQIHGGGRDEQIRKLVLRLHHHSQARPDAAGWLARQRTQFSSTEPTEWERWLPKAIEDWRDEWLPVLESLGTPVSRPGALVDSLKRAGSETGAPGANEKAVELATILSRLGGAMSTPGWRQTAADVLEQVIVADANWPAKRKTVLRKPIEGIFEEAEFLHSLAVVKNGVDPLVEDWSWVRGQMETLLRLAEEFASKLAERKLTNAVLDFHDLEQFALKLLWDFSSDRPTLVAAAWREKLQFVFVDEYQDINAAQDKIIAALSGEGKEANRFLVGDVKQSIYRFRLADPKIFRDYAQHWQGTLGQVIPLSENFRSQASLLSLVNSVFRLVMRPEVGGVAYDTDAELKYPGTQAGGDSSGAMQSAPRAELLLRFKSGRNQGRDDESAELANLDETQREARLVAWRLRQLVAEGHEIFDGEKKMSRPVEWRDMAILLRSPRGRSEIFAKEFERAGVPLAVARGGFFESAEILDLLSLLQLLDNPLQDVPCIAVLRSPLVGLTLDELAEIRLVAREKHFWTVLNRSAELKNSETRAKISKFLERFSRWRGMVKLVSLSQCLEEVLTETFYADWLRAQPGGARRAANIAGLLQLAQQFDQFQQQGLFRFLKFIAAQQEADVEPEVPAMAAENAVRLMSIHQSKGLEFPVVVLADLAKSFNERDLHSEIIFDEEFGLCPKVKPPQTGRRYPSLPHWLAQRRQKRELRGEELRLLYVALTRARENLILTASITEKSWDEKWMKPQPATVQKVATAKCFADWLALWFSNQVQSPKPKVQSQSGGELEDLRWQVVSDEELQESRQNDETQFQIGNRQSKIGNESESPHVGSYKDLEALRGRLEWSYPFTAATQRKAKSSVTALRREAEELDEEAEQVFPERRQVLRLKGGAGKRVLSAPEIGAAHHKFLQLVRLDKVDGLAEEAERLVRENYLSADERAVLDLTALAAFWNSPLGRKIQAHAEDVRRELPFTARFSPMELAKITGDEPGAGMEDEFVIVQGVADLVVLRPREIWLVDFKTDEMAVSELPGKVKMYSPQLRLYAAAVEKIFARKVTLRALHFLAARRTVEI